MTIVDDSCALLARVGAPERLVTHGRLVAEAAQLLLDVLARHGVSLDASWVLAGAVLHDAGKAVFRSELDAPGHRHEPAGEELLLRHGIEAHVARCARSHAAWAEAATPEELVVALADKLWKGVRVEALERLVIEAVARATAKPRWELFIALDSSFEEIAAGGTERLARSR